MEEREVSVRWTMCSFEGTKSEQRAGWFLLFFVCQRAGYTSSMQSIQECKAFKNACMK